MRPRRMSRNAEMVRTGFLLAVIVGLVLGFTAWADADVITEVNSDNDLGDTTADGDVVYDGTHIGGGWEGQNIANPNDFDGGGTDAPANLNVFQADADGTAPSDLGSLTANMSAGTQQHLIYVQGISVVDQADEATAALTVTNGTGYNFAYVDDDDDDTYTNSTDDILLNGFGVRIEGDSGTAGVVSAHAGGRPTRPSN